MRIFDYFKKEDKIAGSAPLKEAIENAPKHRGFYIITIDSDKKYIGLAEEGLKEKFIELYSGLKLDGEPVAVDAYENRDKVVVHWVEESSMEDAQKYIDKFKSTYDLEWQR